MVSDDLWLHPAGRADERHHGPDQWAVALRGAIPGLSPGQTGGQRVISSTATVPESLKGLSHEMDFAFEDMYG